MRLRVKSCRALQFEEYVRKLLVHGSMPFAKRREQGFCDLSAIQMQCHGSNHEPVRMSLAGQCCFRLGLQAC